MDFTYKLDRKLFQPLITNMDWLEESELRKFQVALKADAATVHATTYPTSIAVAYQRATQESQQARWPTTTKRSLPAKPRVTQATRRIKTNERRFRMENGSK